MEAQDNISKQFREAARNMESMPSFSSMERVWNKVEERLDEGPEQRRSTPFWRMGIAAAVLVAVSISALYLLRRDDQPENSAQSMARNERKDSKPVQQTGGTVQQLPAVQQTPAVVVTPRTVNTRKATQHAYLAGTHGVAEASALAVADNRHTAADSISRGLAAQTDAGKRKIKGLVTDENMEPVIGAMVLLKGTTISTQTDVNGMYAIEVGNDRQLLEFKAAGMESKEIAASQENTLIIKMKEDKSLLPEAITYGGSFDRRAFNGLQVPVYSKDIADKPVIDIAKAIATHAPGTEIRSGGGQPGDNAFSFGQSYQFSTPTAAYDNSKRNNGHAFPQLTLSNMQQAYSLKPNEKTYLGAAGDGKRMQQSTEPAVVLRGTSMASGNEPLIVVDGSPFNGKLNDIDPENIASIKALKDSTATRLYGSRSANGVIQVMTRKAVEKNTNPKKAWNKARRFLGVKKGVSAATPQVPE